MFTKQVIITVIITLTISAGASAQGEFLRPAESGIEIYGGLVSNENSDGYSFGLGYSLKGRFDFSFAATSDSDVDAQSYAVGATYYVKHFHKQGMFGMGVMFGYGSLHGGRRRDVNALILGVVIFNNIYMTRDLALQPYLSGTVWRNSNAAVGSGQFGITAILAHKAQVRPFIRAGIGSSDDQSFTVVSGGLVAVL